MCYFDIPLADILFSLMIIRPYNSNLHIRYLFFSPPDYYMYLMGAVVMSLLFPPFGLTALFHSIRSLRLHKSGKSTLDPYVVRTYICMINVSLLSSVPVDVHNPKSFL